jgi:NADH-quinone oxidoreductase subunit C
MPWEGAEYRLPGDEKAEPQAPGAPTAAAATGAPPKVEAKPAAAGKLGPPGLADQGGGKPADKQAHKDARKPNHAKAEQEVSKASDIPNPKPKGAGRRRPGGGPG